MIDLDKLQTILSTAILNTDSGHLALLPNTMHVANIEPLETTPNRHRGHFTTNRLADLFDYIDANTESTALFIDAPNLTATAVLNFGTVASPAWQDHTATFTAEQTPIYAALLALCGPLDTIVTQKTLLDFIDDWMPKISFSRDQTAIATPVARQLFADLTTEKVRRAASNVSQAFQRERSAAERISMGDGLPDTLHCECEPYYKLGPHNITIAIGAAEHAGNPAVTLRQIGAKALDETIRTNLIATITDIDSNIADCQTYTGAYQTGLEPALRTADA